MRRLTPVLAVVPLLLSACAGSSTTAVQDSAAAPDGDRVLVAASFYPLQWLVERVGGDAVEVRGLTPAGTEPHDVEVSVQDRRWLEDADAVLHLGRGFQPGIDRVLETLDGQVRQVDLLTAPSLELLELAGGDEHSDAEGERSVDEDDHAHDGPDPHVWIDPVRATVLARYIAEVVLEAAPDRRQQVEADLAALEGDLAALDEELSAALADCERRTIVTSHDAFGYLADRYDLEQVPLAGLSADDEADPGTLAELTALARDRGVTTVFTEEVLSPAVAEAVAREVGATTAMLGILEFDPREALGPDEDYLSVQRRNGAALSAGLGCR